MSNTMMVRGTLSLTRDEADLERLLADAQAHKDHKFGAAMREHLQNEVDRVDCCDGVERDCGGVFHYFLVLGMNMKQTKQGKVVIKFGKGRSTHTFRDWKWTLKVLERYLKRPVEFEVFEQDLDWDPRSGGGYKQGYLLNPESESKEASQ